MKNFKIFEYFSKGNITISFLISSVLQLKSSFSINDLYKDISIFPFLDEII